MLKLRTLGGLTLDGFESSAVGSAVLHRKRLALLAILGASDGVSRDKLLGLLWPESSETRARHALAQSLYALRRALNNDDLVLGNQELRINRAVVEVDAWSFDRLIDAARLEDAVALYRGPFLDGVYLDDADAFEEWVSTERQRLSHRYARALESLAAEAERARAFGQAVKWWRELALFDPLAAGPALGLMRSLVSSGNAAAALKHASAYQARVASELGIQSSPEVSAFANTVRAQLSAATPTAPVSLSPASQAPIKPAMGDVRLTTALPSRKRERARSRRGEIGVAIVCLLLLATFGIARFARGSKGGAARLDPDRVAVFPFVAGAAGVDYLADGMVNLLAAALDSAATVQIVDPRSLLSRVNCAPRSRTDPAAAAAIAKEFGASAFVLGNVTELNGRMELSASLYNTSTKEVVTRASATGDRSATFGLIDHLAAELLAARLKTPGQRLDQLAALTTSSLPALKAYLLGEREMRARHYLFAIDHFQEAIALDTSFALAHYRLSMAADWSGEATLADSAAARAARHASRLSAHDRMLVEALAAWRTNDIDEAERQYRTLILHHFYDVEAWYQLGEVYFHNNPPRGRSFLDARAPLERALALEPTDPNGPMHLLRIAAWEERWSAADSLVRRLDPKEADATLAPYRALARGDTAALTRAIAGLSVVDSNSLYVSTERLAIYTHRLDVAERLGAALTSPSRPRHDRAMGYHLLAYLEAAQGRWTHARAYADSARLFALHYGIETKARLAAAPFAPFSAKELETLRREVLASRSVAAVKDTNWGMLHYAPREYPDRFMALAALLSARLSDTAALRAEAAGLHGSDTTKSPEWQNWRHDRIRLLRAWSMRLAGRPADAVASLDSLHPPDAWGTRDEERFLLAEMLRDSGHPDDALRWFGSFEQIGIDELPWAAPAHLMRARLLDRLGRQQEAVADYARVAELWKDCDRELQPLRDEARRRAR